MYSQVNISELFEIIGNKEYIIIKQQAQLAAMQTKLEALTKQLEAKG